MVDPVETLIDKSPLVSCIVTCFQAEKCLERCLKSVQQQTYPNIEIILVDDCSLDKTLSIANTYAKTDPRISVLKNSVNSGTGVARHKGYVYSKGEYILFIDCDDTMQHNMIEKLVKCAQDNNADVVCCAYTQIGRFIKRKRLTKAPFILCNGKDLLFKYSDKQNNAHYFADPGGQLWNKLIRKKIFDKHSLRSFKTYAYAEDYFLTLQAYSFANIVCFLPEPLYNYYNQTSPFKLTTSHRYFQDVSVFTTNARQFYMDNNLFSEKEKEIFLHGVIESFVDYPIKKCISIFRMKKSIEFMNIFRKNLYKDLDLYNELQKHSEFSIFKTIFPEIITKEINKKQFIKFFFVFRMDKIIKGCKDLRYHILKEILPEKIFSYLQQLKQKMKEVK